MSDNRNLENLKKSWADLAEGNLDSLAAAYAEMGRFDDARMANF